MREFNITGICVSEMHYMVDTSDKLDEITKMIDEEEYFVINRPRQYGKTTTLSLLKRKLSERYLIINISFEISNNVFNSRDTFVYVFKDYVKEALIRSNVNPEIITEWEGCADKNLPSMINLSKNITSLVNSLDKEVILMIDEIDKSSGDEAFLDFLGLLRAKYIARNEGRDKTFKSVILAGVSDVSNLRSYEYHETHSPWNIATPFKVDMSYSPEEISTILVAV